jgi:hypothetical protein
LGWRSNVIAPAVALIVSGDADADPVSLLNVALPAVLEKVVPLLHVWLPEIVTVPALVKLAPVENAPVCVNDPVLLMAPAKKLPLPVNVPVLVSAPPDISSKAVDGTDICPLFVTGEPMVPLTLKVPVDSLVTAAPLSVPLIVKVPRLSSPAPPAVTVLLCRIVNVPSFSMPLLGVKWAVNGNGTSSAHTPRAAEVCSDPCLHPRAIASASSARFVPSTGTPAEG